MIEMVKLSYTIDGTGQLSNMIKDVLSGRREWLHHTVDSRLHVNFINVDYDEVRKSIRDWLLVPGRVTTDEDSK